MRRLIRLVARVWFRTFLSGRLPPSAAFEPISEVARHRVHQGIPIESMLQAWQIGAGVFWKTIVAAAKGDPEVESKILHRISPLAFAVLQKSSEAISRAYLEELGASARWQRRIREEFTGLVLAGEQNEEALGRRLAALGLDAEGTVQAVAFHVRRSGGLARRSEIAVHALADALGADPGSWVTADRDRDLLIWLPGPDDSPEHERQLRSACERVLARDSGVVSAGVGMLSKGPLGWRQSAEQALRAASLARAGSPPHVQTYRRIAVYDFALGSPKLRDVLRSLVSRLETNPTLRETLEVYFDEGRRAKATASRLGLHPSTLTYRLRRAQKALGGDLDDPDYCLALALALKLRRLQRSEAVSPGHESR